LRFGIYGRVDARRVAEANAGGLGVAASPVCK